MRIIVTTLVLLAMAGGIVRGAESDDLYNAFNKFCIDHFGPTYEPLVLDTFGNELKLNPDGTWSHISENSAVLAFATNLPATTHIEYGIDKAYDHKTTATERPFYTHIHHLTQLKTGQTYNYRLVAVDHLGKQVVLNEGAITTKQIDKAIRIPDDVKGAPYNLTQANATYVLTRDIVADSNAINIMAPGITLDLNGYCVTYDNVAGADPGPEKGFGNFGMQGPHGVRNSYGGRGARILNGFIVQGKGNSGAGSQPIYSTGIAEIAGVSIRYTGAQLVGIKSGQHAHHNIILDAGTVITDRHMGISGIGAVSKAEYNLIKRARQRGVTGVSGGEYRGNEIYVDSYDTNSFGIMIYKQVGVSIKDNRIFGTGYHVLGIGTVSQGVKDVMVENNFIHLHATAPNTRSAEYGPQSEAQCVRVTWGGENIQYLNNVMIANADSGGEVSGIWHYSQSEGQRDVVYRGNIVKILRKDDRPADGKLEGAVRICGDGKTNAAPVLLEDNTVISNYCNVRLGDGYGVGSNAQFVGNTFIRVGEHKNYVTVQCGHSNRPSVGHVFKDTKFSGGAGFDLVRWEGTGQRGFTVIEADGQPKAFSPPAQLNPAQ